MCRFHAIRKRCPICSGTSVTITFDWRVSFYDNEHTNSRQEVLLLWYEIELRTYDIHNPLLTSSETLLGCLEAAQEIGVDLTNALSTHGIQAESLVSPKGFLAFHQVANFLNHVASEFNYPDFGFLVGKHQPALQFGPMAQLPKLSSNLNEAIQNALQYSLSNSEVSLWELKPEDGFASLVRHNRVSYDGHLTQLHTLAVTVTFNAMRSIAGKHWQASTVNFTHDAPEDVNPYIRYFGCSVNFNQDFNGIVFPESLLQIPLQTSDPELLAIVKRYLDSVNIGYQLHDDMATKVQHHIKRNLGANLCNLESIAQQLDQQPRTLQRELRKHGVTFRELLAEVRQDVAEHYLRSSGIHLADLADILGYRNVSAFSRAFKNACGMSPEHWKRENNRATLERT